MTLPSITSLFITDDNGNVITQPAVPALPDGETVPPDEEGETETHRRRCPRRHGAQAAPKRRTLDKNFLHRKENCCRSSPDKTSGLLPAVFFTCIF